jgi:uncharacterized membrane protein
MFDLYAQAAAVCLIGVGIGWVLLFSFVVAPVAFKTFDQGRAERLIKAVMKAGHGALAAICLLAGLACLFAGGIGAAVVAAIAAIFALGCQWALAPREDKPIRGHRVLKTARIVASALTFTIAPILLTAAVLLGMGV